LSNINNSSKQIFYHSPPQCIKKYGPYVFTEAKSPSHRKNKQTDRLLTHIHSKWYDLSTFEHPGGPVALSLIDRRDGTALFESHHPFIERAKLLKILSKYEVPKKDEEKLGCKLLDQTDGGHYVWDGIENDKFASDLKVLVNEYFGNVAKERGVSLSEAAKATPARWCLIISLMTCFYGTLPWYTSGSWPFIVLTPMMAWVTAVNYWHDGLHFSLSTDWRINAWLPYLFPYYSSPWMWYHEHVIGHHSYPNVSHKDPDLAHAPQLMREHDSIKWRKTHVGQSQWHRVLFVWSVALGIGLSLLNDVKANLKLSYNNVVPYAPMSKPRLVVHILGRLGYFFILHVWPYFTFPLWKAIIWSTLPGIMLSVCFMVNTQINHLTNGCAHAMDDNFYKHQVVTAQNFGVGNLFCYYFSGGLNYQIEHHLFPNVNHCHLPALAPSVKRICEKHGVPYHHAAGYRDAIARHFAHTSDMEKQPA
jgi:delta11-fatty-acid desaturase